MSEASSGGPQGKVVARARRGAGLLLWALASLLATGGAWWLWKYDGRQLMAAPGEILLTMSRAEAIDLPYPVDDLGGQWGPVLLGELPAKYGRMTGALLAWWLGTGMLLGVLWRSGRAGGLQRIRRVLMSLAGIGAFLGGVFLLQAALRAGANIERMAGVGALDPFLFARLLPLSLATRACALLLLASMLLALAGFGLRQKSNDLACDAPRYRVLPFGLCLAISLLAVAVLVGQAVLVRLGPLPHLLDHRLGELPERDTVDAINGMLGGLRLSGIAVQLAGLLWIVAAWVAPGRVTRRTSRKS